MKQIITIAKLKNRRIQVWRSIAENKPSFRIRFKRLINKKEVPEFEKAQRNHENI